MKPLSVRDMREAYLLWKRDCPIRKWRVLNGWSLDMVAARVGVSLMAVSRWESGSSYPSDGHFEQLKTITENPALEQEFREWRRNLPF